MKLVRYYIFLIGLIALSFSGKADNEKKEHPLITEFKEKHEKNLSYVRRGLYDSTDFIISHPLISKRFSFQTLESAQKLLRDFNRKHGIYLYFNLVVVVEGSDSLMSSDGIYSSVPPPTNVIQGANINGALVQLRFAHLVTSNASESIPQRIDLSFGTSTSWKSCNSHLSEKIRLESSASRSFEESPNEALLGYVQASIDAFEKCMDKNDSTDPALQTFKYVMKPGVQSSFGNNESLASNKLAESTDPTTSSRSIFDYGGLLTEQQEKIIQDIIASQIGGGNIPFKYYTTNSSTNSTLFGRIKGITAPSQGILIWNHYDPVTNQLYTSISLGEEIKTRLNQVKVDAGKLVDRIWQSFKDVVREPDKIFTGDNALIKSVLVAHPLVMSITSSYWSAKLLIKILEYVEIPVEVYDPLHAGYYPIMNMLVPWDKKEQFAFLCGLINGLNSEIKGLAELVEMLIGYFVDDQKKAEINTMFSKLSEANLIDLWKQNLQNKYSGNPCVISHQVGKDVLAVGTIFIGVGTVTKVGKISLILKFTNPIRDLFTGLAKLGKFVIKTSDNLLEITCSRIRVIIRKSVTKDTEIASISYVDKSTGATISNPEKYLPDEYASYDLDWSGLYAQKKFPAGDGSFYPITETFDIADGFENIQGKFFKVADGTPDGKLEFIGKDLISGTVSTVVRFIAKNGDELRTYLNSIVSKPIGKSYDGKMYRYIGSQYNNPMEIHPGITDIDNRFRRGLYLSESKQGNLHEVSAYGGTSGKTLYEVTDVKVSNLLDLTDATTLEKLGTSFEQMKKIDPNNLIQYEFTHVISEWAKRNGYSGIKFKGARSVEDYTNFVLFEQTTVDNSIKGTVTAISW